MKPTQKEIGKMVYILMLFIIAHIPLSAQEKNNIFSPTIIRDEFIPNYVPLDHIAQKHIANTRYFNALISKDTEQQSAYRCHNLYNHNFTDCDGNNFLHQLCNIQSKKNNCFICEQDLHGALITLLQDYTDPHEYNKDGLSACFRIFERGCIPCMKILQKYEFDFNVGIVESSTITPLHYAVLCLQKDVIDFLIKQKNINLTPQDNCKKTPLYHLICNYEKDIYTTALVAEKLHQFGAKLYKNSRKRPAKSETLLNEFINHQISLKYIDAKDPAGNNLFMSATILEHIVLCSFTEVKSKKRPAKARPNQ